MDDVTNKVKPPHTLARIADAVRRRLEVRKGLLSPHGMAQNVEHILAQRRIEPSGQRWFPPRDFQQAFAAKGPNIIAEIKFASPSQGVIAKGLNPTNVAKAYLSSGAAALSVLTEEDFFHGHLDHLRAVRKAYPDALLLQKDFVIEPYQVQEALCAGADAVLIIVALVGKEGSDLLQREARRLGLKALVEVHHEDELEVAKDIGADLIGINNRSLLDLSVSLDVTRRLRPLCPPHATVICESGLATQAQLEEMAALGCHGFLIGTSLMDTGDPGGALRRLLGASQGDNPQRGPSCV